VDFPSDELAVKFIHDCIDSGINYLDTAPIYQHERRPAQQRTAIRLALCASGGKRCTLNTKSMKRNADELRRDIETSLKLLQTDYLDSSKISLRGPGEGRRPQLGQAPTGSHRWYRKLKDQKALPRVSSGVTSHVMQLRR